MNTETENEIVKLPSPAETDILRLLHKHGESGGLFLLRSSPLLFRGTVYTLLNRMKEKGLIVSRDERPAGDGLPRLLYKITAFGLRTLAEATREQLPPAASAKTDDELRKAERVVVDHCIEKAEAGWCKFCPFDRPHSRRHEPTCPLLVNGFIDAQGKRLR